MPSAYHVVHYKLFDPQPKASRSLEVLCRSALSAKNGAGATLWQRAQDRIFDLPNVASRKVVLNKVADMESAVFGELCLIQSDGLQALLELNTADVQTSDHCSADIARRGAPRELMLPDRAA